MILFLTGDTVQNKKFIHDCFRFTQILYLAGKILEVQKIWVAEMPCFAMALTMNVIPYDVIDDPEFSTQNTADSHIRNILKDLLNCEFKGKHNQANSKLFNEGRTFLGSIRDPWVWYTSLILSLPKTNVSSRKHGPDYYYDIKSENLIAEREKLIVEKFGYVAPKQRGIT